MGLGQCISNAVLLDLWQLCEIDEKQYNMGALIHFTVPLKYTVWVYPYMDACDAY